MTRRRVTAKGGGAMVGKQVLLGAVIALALVGANGVAASADSGAAQVAGIGTFDIDQEICDRGVAEEIVPPIVMTGDLNGCWYTNSFTGRSHPSGTYQETDTETFVGCLADERRVEHLARRIGSRPSSRPTGRRSSDAASTRSFPEVAPRASRACPVESISRTMSMPDCSGTAAT